VKHPERVEDYLEHIAEAIERTTGYLQTVPDLAAFRNFAISRSSAKP
jgi:hypothetical protein